MTANPPPQLSGERYPRPETHPGPGMQPGRKDAPPPQGGDELLQAVMALASNLELPAVLDLIVNSARRLTGATYAALGVLAVDEPAPGDRYLSQFHPLGIAPEFVAALGAPPHGRGVLGVVIDDPRPLRLSEISEHPASVGMPPGHPEMHTFLGVPIRVREQVFGNLYLTEKIDGTAFTAADEQVVTGLAAAAGVAIENARLFDERSRRHRWLAAAAEAAAAVTSDLRQAATVVAEQARHAGGCTQVAVSLPTTAVDDGDLLTDAHDDTAVINSVAGDGTAELINREVSIPAGTTGKPVFDDGLAVQTVFRVRDRTIGVLALRRSAPPWSASELDSVQAFTDHVALAVEHARNEHNRHRLAVFTDRDRIARDLHDHVIQRVFAVGLGLQGLLRRTTDPDARERLAGFANDLDATISEIRTTIFSLHRQSEDGPQSLRGDIFAVIGEAARVLGFEPEITLVGPIDAVVPAHLNDDVLATLRESLSNVVRHAQADAVNVLVRVDMADKTLTIQVEDNGVGITPAVNPGSGLRNTAARAAAAGGHATVARRQEPGTSFVWVVPLPV